MRNKTIKIMILGTAFASLLSSCGDDWFEEDPKIFLPMNRYGTILPW